MDEKFHPYYTLQMTFLSLFRSLCNQSSDNKHRFDFMTTHCMVFITSILHNFRKTNRRHRHDFRCDSKSTNPALVLCIEYCILYTIAIDFFLSSSFYCEPEPQTGRIYVRFCISSFEVSHFIWSTNKKMLLSVCLQQQMTCSSVFCDE